MNIFVNILAILSMALIVLLPFILMFLMALCAETQYDKEHNKNRTFKEKCKAINKLFSIEVRRK